MNETIVDFLKSLNINLSRFNSLDGSSVKRGYDINPILSRFAIWKIKQEDKVISINDVVGYDYACMNLDNNLLENLSRFFDRDGDNYYRRSVSMLEIPQNQLMEQLAYSFKREPICLQEVDKGVYNIGSNGMHRFHVIKTHFLDELSKLNPSDKSAIKKLEEKYSFSARVFEIDYVKSYSSFMLHFLDDNLKLEIHFNENYELTDKSCLIDFSKSDKKTILTNDELITMVNKKYNHFLKTANKREINQLKEVLKNALKFDSFKNYYESILKQNEQGEREWS